MYAFLTQTLAFRESGTYALKIVLGSFLIAVAAQICIPAYPVPMTLHVSAILFLALISSPSVAMGAVMLYLFEGAIGLPVFAGFSGGLVKFVGPTAGYLMGFVIATYIVSTLKSKVSGFFGHYLIAALGGASILLCGTAYLSTLMGVQAAVISGLVPFALKMLVEAGIAVVSARVLKKI